jgi:hypothetical protein
LPHGRAEEGDVGEERTGMWVPSISDGGAGNDNGPLAHEIRPGAEEMAHNDFSHFSSFFQLNESAGGNKIVEILGTSEKCKNLHEDRFEYLTQLLYWAL